MAATSSGTPKMSDQEKFFFDLNGFLHVRGALSKEEVERMNKAIDAHSGEIKVQSCSFLSSLHSLRLVERACRSARTVSFATQAA